MSEGSLPVSHERLRLRPFGSYRSVTNCLPALTHNEDSIHKKSPLARTLRAEAGLIGHAFLGVIAYQLEKIVRRSKRVT